MGAGFKIAVILASVTVFIVGSLFVGLSQVMRDIREILENS